MSDESDNYEFSDAEIDEKKHTKLVEEVLNLNKIQNVKKPSRTEPTLQISEFNLVKSVTGNKGSVHLNELTKVLKGRKKQEISKKVKATSTKSKTLPTPLEKPQADRIRRTVNYEKSRLQLDRWEALVTSNRAASQLVFPLDSIEKLKIEDKKAENYPSTWRLKSDLQKDLEKIESKVEEYHINPEDKGRFPLTLEEIVERRKEAAKLRAHQSYKEAKARRQNKIKSKKYHRILRREKIKQKLKEFEELQKTNPEEALKKLEDIEKARAEERFSLRHKGTGQWAKNKQVRAKYDKESRQELAQQLAISRELTQKLKSIDSDSEDEGIESEGNSKPHKVDDSNHWIAGEGIKPGKEVADFVKSYKEYWGKANEKLQTNRDGNANDSTENIGKPEESVGDVTEEAGKAVTAAEKFVKVKKVPKSKKNGDTNDTTENIEKPEESVGDIKETEKAGKAVTETEKFVKVKKISKSNKNVRKNNKLKEKKRKETSETNSSVSTSEWEVSVLDENDEENDIEDIFDKLEEKLNQKIKSKYSKVKSSNLNKSKTKKIKKKSNKKKVDLTMPSKSKKHIIDEELIEQPQTINDNQERIEQDANSNLSSLKTILNTIEAEKKQTTDDKQVSDIDPEKFVQIKKTNLNTALPDISVTDDNEEGNDQRDIILEAFEDDDIAEDFAKEKFEEIKKDTPQDFDLNLPGWGSWAGANIKSSKRKSRRFIIKMPQKIPRRDDNKGSLIINEKAQSKVKPHMVSEVPFPFKTVKDYEASIRAPIGNTFVPEIAFRRLIEPAVVTKMGAIIEPITKSVLVGTKKV